MFIARHGLVLAPNTCYATTPCLPDRQIWVKFTMPDDIDAWPMHAASPRNQTLKLSIVFLFVLCLANSFYNLRL